MSQTLILKNLAIFVRIFNQHKSQTHDSEVFMSELNYGHCHGFVVCHSVMDLMDKIAWWEAALVALANWHDGSDIKDTIYLEKKLYQLIVLPDSDQDKPITLLELFTRVLNYIISYQVHNTFQFEGRFIPSEMKQSNSLATKSAYIEYVHHGRIMRLAHHHKKIVDPDLSPQLLKYLFDGNAIRFHACHVASAGHVVRVGFDGNKWFIYDPNHSHFKLDKIRTYHNSIDDLLLALKHIFARRECFQIDHFTFQKSRPILLPKLAMHLTEQFGSITFLRLQPTEIDAHLPNMLLQELRDYARFRKGHEMIARMLAMLSENGESGLHFLSQLALYNDDPVILAVDLATKTTDSTQIFVKALGHRNLSGRSGLHQLTEHCPEAAIFVLRHLTENIFKISELFDSLQKNNAISNQPEIIDIICMLSLHDDGMAALLDFCQHYRQGNTLLLTALRNNLLQRLFATGLHRIITTDTLLRLFNISLSAPNGARELVTALSGYYQTTPALIALHDSESFSATAIFEMIANNKSNTRVLLGHLADRKNHLLSILLPQLTDTEHTDLITLLMKSKNRYTPRLLRRCLLAKNKSEKSGLETLDMHATYHITTLLDKLTCRSQNLPIYIQLLESGKHRSHATQKIKETLGTRSVSRLDVTHLMRAIAIPYRLGGYGIHAILSHYPSIVTELLKFAQAEEKNQHHVICELLTYLFENNKNNKNGFLSLHQGNLEDFKLLLALIGQSISATEQLVNHLVLEKEFSQTYFAYYAQYQPALLQLTLKMLASHANTQPILRDLLDRKHPYRKSSPLRFNHRGIDLLKISAPALVNEFEKYATPHKFTSAGSSDSSYNTSDSQSCDDSQTSMIVLDSFISDESTNTTHAFLLNAPAGITQRIELTGSTITGSPNTSSLISKMLLSKHGIKQLPGLYLLAKYGSADAMQYIRSQDKYLVSMIAAAKTLQENDPDRFMVSALELVLETDLSCAKELVLRNPACLSDALNYLIDHEEAYTKLIDFFAAQFPLLTEYLVSALRSKASHEKIGAQVVLEKMPGLFVNLIARIARQQPTIKQDSSPSNFCISRRHLIDMLNNHINKSGSVAHSGLFSSKHCMTAILDMATAKNKAHRGTAALNYLEIKEKNPLAKQLSSEFKEYKKK